MTGSRGHTPDAPDVLVNLTGRPLHLYQGGRKVRTLDPADQRGYQLPQKETPADPIDGIDVVDTRVGALGLLPAPTEGAWLVVSQVAALGLALTGAGRTDILYPGPGVSDRGRTVGCRGLRRLVPAEEALG